MIWRDANSMEFTMASTADREERKRLAQGVASAGRQTKEKGRDDRRRSGIERHRTIVVDVA
jgi:hypothetical protein